MIKSATIRLFENILRDEFKLKSRIHINKCRVIRYDGDSCFGDYRGESIGRGKFMHKIRIATSEVKSDYDLFATLAHEYVHAWQMEKLLDLDHDSKSGFTKWKNYFKAYYQIDIESMQPD